MKIVFEGTGIECQVLMQHLTNISISGVRNLPVASVDYATEHLWHSDDVTNKYDCSRGQAIDLIDTVLGSDRIMSEINEAIDLAADIVGFSKKEESE